MNTVPNTPDTNPVKKDNIAADPSVPQVNPSFKPADPVKKTDSPNVEPSTYPDVEPDRDHERKYGYENEYNTV